MSLLLNYKWLCPLILCLIVFAIKCKGQTEARYENEFWPTFNATFEVAPRSRVNFTAQKRDGEDAYYQQNIVGAVFSYRTARIANRLRGDIDKENEYNLVIGGGYQYIRTKQTSGVKDEQRVLVQFTPKYIIGPAILVQDRSQMEFRWIDGQYNFRYRNKVIIDRPFKLNKFRLSPYASGELFWDRNHHAWDENQYAFGIQVPFKKVLLLDTYYLRQNCTTCSLNPLNVLGVTVSLFSNWPYKR